MIKRILVPTDGSEYASIGVRYAVALAKRYKAALLGLHVVDIKLLEGPFLRDISASLGTAPYVNYQGNISMILEERGNAALDSFRHACEEAGVTCETCQATGIVPRCIVEKSELADLIVMGRGGEHGQWLDGPGDEVHPRGRLHLQARRQACHRGMRQVPQAEAGGGGPGHGGLQGAVARMHWLP